MARKGDDIAERLLDLAAFVLKLGPELKRNGAPRKVIDQLQSAGTSGGANYEEARGAESPADFVHKVRVAVKEVRETRYWLRTLVRAELLRATDDVAHYINEGDELTAILTASARTARRRMDEQRK